MIVLDLEGLVPNIFNEDIKTNNRNTYISQMTILTIKSLLPMKDEVGNQIDYKRFKEELKLWKGYCVGENISLLCALDTLNNKEYFTYFDETFYTRLLPIVISNNDFKIIEEELIKNILYFSGNLPNLFEWLVIGLIVYLLINKDKDIIGNLKEYIINFSQIEFIDQYKGCFPIEADAIPNDFKISFEKERISLLSILNGIHSSKYPYLNDLLAVLDGKEPSTSIGKIIYNSCNYVGLDSVDMFYMSMSKYLLKLRKGRIDIEDLKIREYILPDIFSFNEGDVFFHSLLNHSKVLKKEVKAGGLTSLITTKSGNYLFKRDPS